MQGKIKLSQTTKTFKYIQLWTKKECCLTFLALPVFVLLKGSCNRLIFFEKLIPCRIQKHSSETDVLN